jgi:hypothetical protein
MTNRINQAGIGAEKHAEEIIEAHAWNLQGLTEGQCQIIFSKEKISEEKCVLLQETMRDNFIDSKERKKLLDAGFSGRFVYRLADGDLLLRRTQRLASFLQFRRGQGDNNWYGTDIMKAIHELGNTKWFDSAPAYVISALKYFTNSRDKNMQSAAIASLQKICPTETLSRIALMK